MGLERTVGTADRGVSGLPALRGATATSAPASPAGRPRFELDSYRPTVVDEVVEIRLGFDPASGRIAIAEGDVRHEPRLAEPDLVTSPAFESDPQTLPDPTAAIGSRVDLVA